MQKKILEIDIKFSKYTNPFNMNLNQNNIYYILISPVVRLVIFFIYNLGNIQNICHE